MHDVERRTRGTLTGDPLACCAPARPALLALLLVCAGGAGAEGDPEHGRELAIRHCALCHVVGDFNKFGGIDSTPSFQMLASMRDGAARFQSFFARRPHPAFVTLPDRGPPTSLPLTVPAVALSYQDVDDLAAFAATLADPRLQPRE